MQSRVHWMMAHTEELARFRTHLKIHFIACCSCSNSVSKIALVWRVFRIFLCNPAVAVASKGHHESNLAYGGPLLLVLDWNQLGLSAQWEESFEHGSRQKCQRHYSKLERWLWYECSFWASQNWHQQQNVGWYVLRRNFFWGQKFSTFSFSFFWPRESQVCRTTLCLLFMFLGHLSSVSWKSMKIQFLVIYLKPFLVNLVNSVSIW